jgi:hypothetical protein
MKVGSGVQLASAFPEVERQVAAATADIERRKPERRQLVEAV